MISFELRSETPTDHTQIDHVVAAAFGRDDEAELVRLLRGSQPGYDPNLSIVAVAGERVIGHVLMTSCDIRLMRETIRAVCVAPVAVAPGQQGLGVGTAMMEYGHQVASRAGFAIAFLHGHPGYYPRLGYRPAMGFAEIAVDLDRLGPTSGDLHRRQVVEADVEWLTELYERELAHVDFGWLWGADIRSWQLDGLKESVWCDSDGSSVGYTIVKPGAENPALLLARDPESAREIVRTIRPASISAHPSGWLASAGLNVDWANATVKPSNAAMAFELQTGVLGAYYDAVKSGERPVGTVNHPLPFMLVD
jgi:putative acetyltransferase